jgi:signal transduction histidine kinase
MGKDICCVSTMFLKNPILLLAMLLLCMAWKQNANALTSVKFREIITSYHAGSIEDVKLTIDGREASPKGWSVAPNFAEPQSAIFVADKPIKADLLNLTMFFMSGRPNSSFAHFSVRYTTDDKPCFTSEWHALPILNFGATASKLSRGQDDHLMAEEVSVILTGRIPDNLFWITARMRNLAITGFKIDVFPMFRSPEFDVAFVGKGPLMAWSREKDFVLTEFRAEILTTSTNVALGASATATHPLYFENERMKAHALTDGWPSTIAHPDEAVAGKDFYFEIDLGQERMMDHLTLRQRGDPYSLDLFSRMRIRVYAKDPKLGASPTWQTLNRADGSFPAQGESDVLQAKHGEGEFRGRYLRISHEDKAPFAPMLAEVEVYETRTARLVSLKADEHLLATDKGLSIPAGVQRLAFQWDIPQAGNPDTALYRWKVQGVSQNWQSSASLLLEIPCPPPGDYSIEIQAAHSDGVWDQEVLSLPFTVCARFTETGGFLWLTGGVTLLAGLVVSRSFSRRKINRLEAKSALAVERSRIARNMHDDVGARLAQLAVLQDVFSREHAMSDEAKADLAALTACAREAMESLDEAVWTVNPRNDTLTALASFVAQYAERYLVPLGISCRVNRLSQLPDLPLLTGIRHEVVMTVKEALQNIVKHAAASEVELTLQYDTGHFLLRVSDNGCGLPTKSGAAGEDGLFNMRQRLESIGGVCNFLPREHGGTIVEMKLFIL